MPELDVQHRDTHHTYLQKTCTPSILPVRAKLKLVQQSLELSLGSILAYRLRDAAAFATLRACADTPQREASRLRQADRLSARDDTTNLRRMPGDRGSSSYGLERPANKLVSRAGPDHGGFGMFKPDGCSLGTRVTQTEIEGRTQESTATFSALATPNAAAQAAVELYGSSAATAAAYCALTARYDGRDLDYQFWFSVFQLLSATDGAPLRTSV